MKQIKHLITTEGEVLVPKHVQQFRVERSPKENSRPAALYVILVDDPTPAPPAPYFMEKLLTPWFTTVVYPSGALCRGPFYRG